MREDYMYPRYDIESPLAETRNELDLLYNDIIHNDEGQDIQEQKKPPLE